MATTSKFSPSSWPSSFSPSEIPQTCDVSVLSSGSNSVTSIVSKLSYHLTNLGVTVAFSGDPAIFNSSVCILILSEDFADSTDRLEELRVIHEHKVDLVPIFFNVMLYEVLRVDSGVFREAFAKVSEEEGFHGWKVAFEGTASIPQWKVAFGTVLRSGVECNVPDGNTMKLLKSVVRNVMGKRKSVSLQVAKYPVGLAEKTEKLKRLLEAGENPSEAKVLGIVGMGGIGKTTLAKEFFDIKKGDYKAACFIEDVKGRIEKSGLEIVQSLLLKDLLKIDHEVHSINQGKYLLKKCLRRNEVVIVLDNIDDPDHLDALWVPGYIHHKSILLITTRDRKLVECIPYSLIYSMEGLDRKCATELFCWHAFLMPRPALGFDHLVEGFVTYCDGFLLSLQVLGGKLLEEKYPVWEKTLNNISESFPGDIESQLRVCYDALDVSEKKIFLDIAIFFIGEDKDMAIRIWNATQRHGIWNAMHWGGSVVVQSLQQKCFVKVDDGHFKMHDQLRQMAEEIVDEEDTQNPGCRSLLWRPSDIRTVLSLKTGSQHVEGITLAGMAKQDGRCGYQVVPMWSLESFRPMRRLRILIFEGACVEGNFGYLSYVIYWLRWRNCPRESFPKEFFISSLHVLDLSGGNFSSLWNEDPPPITSVDPDFHVMPVPAMLEELHLRGCMSLERLPKSIECLDGYLEKLVLSHCTSLVDIPAELCEVYSLKYLDLSGCSGLHSLPDRLGNWKRLQYLDLSHCKKLESLPSTFGGLEKLEHLDLTSCSALNELPSSFQKLQQIRHLNLSLCDNLVDEINLLVCFSKLEFLNTMFCQRFDIHAVTFQCCIRTLKISCAQFKVLPHYLRELENLEDLSLCQGYEVKTLDPFVFTKLYHLKNLSIVQFPLLEDLGSSLGSLTELKSFSIAQCGILRLPEEIGYLKGLEHLQIHDCSNLVELPMGVKGLSSLTIFRYAVVLIFSG